MSRGADTAHSKQPSKTLSRGQTRGSRGVTQGAPSTRQSQCVTKESEEFDGDDGVSQTESRLRTVATGNKTSLFDPANAGQTADGGGDGVKANDIWNKFVSDDQEVVRAPTAETLDTGTRSSQRSIGSQGSKAKSQGSSKVEEDEEEEEEESDDDRTIYSDYYLPPAYELEPITEPRVAITDSHEACSCFPDRSNKLIGSMLYDKIQCVHTGLVGHTQPGVFKFVPFWNENMEEPKKMRKRDMRIAKTKFVFGYPRPRFEIVSESEDEEDAEGDIADENDEDDDETDTHDAPRLPTVGSKSRHTETPKTSKTSRSRATADDSEYDSEDYDDEVDEEYLPFQLPQIGYPDTPSLPPSSQSFRSRYSGYTESVPDLPSLPPSRNLTAQTTRTHKTHFTGQRAATVKTAKTDKTKGSKSKKKSSVDSGYEEDGRSGRSTESRQSLPDGPVISTTRTFQGRFFDPVTKQVMLYDIGTTPGRRLPVGNIEPLNKAPLVPETGKQTLKSGSNPSGSKPGTRESNKSQTSHHSVPKAAVLGAVSISNMLRANKKNKENIEAAVEGEDWAGQ